MYIRLSGRGRLHRGRSDDSAWLAMTAGWQLARRNQTRLPKLTPPPATVALPSVSRTFHIESQQPTMNQAQAVLRRTATASCRQLSGGRTWEGEFAPTVLSRSGFCRFFQLPQDNKEFFSTHPSRVSCNLSLSTYPLPDSRFWRQAPMSSFLLLFSLRNDEAVIGSIASAFSPTGFEFLNSPSHRAMSLQLPTVM
jgi:hypothetical protein